MIRVMERVRLWSWRWVAYSSSGAPHLSTIGGGRTTSKVEKPGWVASRKNSFEHGSDAEPWAVEKFLLKIFFITKAFVRFQSGRAMLERASLYDSTGAPTRTPRV